MAARPADDESVLVLRLMVTPDGSVRIRVIAVTPTAGDRVLGHVTSSTAAATLVREWIDAAAERVRSPESPHGR